MALSLALDQDLGSLACLDIGCSRGLITKHLAPRFGVTLGIEHDAQALAHAAPSAAPLLGFVRGDGQSLPIQDGAVDVVVCAQVYEHVDDVEALLSEIWRVLKPGGVCFFSGPNRLFPWEFHARLPFVHWLPYAWARACVRLLGRGKGYDVRPLALWTLRRRLGRFAIQDLTVAMVRDPDLFSCGEELGHSRWLGRLPESLLRAMLPLVPNFNWILIKAET
jgi:SAM-dependent methyltransferase